MVWKKIIVVCALLPIVLGTVCAQVSALDLTTYDGNISSTYTAYYKDILSSVSIHDNYIYLRSGQYTYDLFVGKLEFTDGVFYSFEPVKRYSINTISNYNGYYSYSVTEVDTLKINVDDKLVYSDLGDFPQLEERSDKYEYIQTSIIVGVCCFSLISSILYCSKRFL